MPPSPLVAFCMFTCFSVRHGTYCRLSSRAQRKIWGLALRLSPYAIARSLEEKSHLLSAALGYVYLSLGVWGRVGRFFGRNNPKPIGAVVTTVLLPPYFL